MRRSFADVASSIGAREAGIALQPLRAGAAQSAGRISDPFAWSSIKPLIVAVLLDDSGGPAGLTDEQRAAARAAITASDNASAMALFEDLADRHGGTDGAAAAMRAMLRRAGDEGTRVSTVGRDGFSPYGQTHWPLREQARFMSALARRCLLSGSSTAYLLGLMNEVQGDQRWGFGRLGAVTAFKGGWGPDPGGSYLVRQIGLAAGEDGEPVAFAAAVRAADGSFERGTAALGRIADWFAQQRVQVPAARYCASASE